MVPYLTSLPRIVYALGVSETQSKAHVLRHHRSLGLADFEPELSEIGIELDTLRKNFKSQFSLKVIS